jgi:hypothetical protein
MGISWLVEVSGKQYNTTMDTVEAGRLGGQKRAKILSKKRRSEIARQGALAKHKKNVRRQNVSVRRV